MKIIAILISLILLSGAFDDVAKQDATRNQLQEIALKHGLNQNDIVIILFYRLGECPSCYMRIFDEFEDVHKNRYKLPYKLVLVAFVNAEREIELKSFTRQRKYFDEVKMYKDSRKSFGLADSIIALTLNGKFQVLDSYTGKEKTIFHTIRTGTK